MPEPKDRLARLRALRGAYLDKVAELERKKSPFAGAFGLKGGPADDPCHEAWAEALRALLQEALGEGIAPRELRELLAELYAPPEKSCPGSAYWMLLAVHGLTEEAVPRLDPADARALEEQYRKDYPRHRRLPAQTKILRLLERRGKEQEKGPDR